MPTPVTACAGGYAGIAHRQNAVAGAAASLLLNGVFLGLIFLALQPGAPMPFAAGREEVAMVWVLPEQGAGVSHQDARGPLQRGPAAGPAGVAPPPARLRDSPVPYVAGATLDIGPEPAGAPDFSGAMQRPALAGTVTLRVYVSSFGMPDRVEILGRPIDGEFAQALRHALEKTSFLPGRRGGRDIAAYVDYEFSTSLVVLPAPPASHNG